MLLAGVAGARRRRALGVAGVTRFDVPGNPTYYLDRQIVYAAVGGFALIVALARRPGPLPPLLARHLRRDRRPDRDRLRARQRRARLDALDQRRLLPFQPSEFGKLLFVLALAGFLAERAAQRRARCARRCARSGSAAIPIVLVFVQPDLGTALVYLAALGAMLFVCGTPWTHLAVLGARRRCSSPSACSGRGPAVGVDFLKTYQKQRLTCFTHPATCPVDATLQRRAVDRRRRLGRGERPRRRQRDADEPRLPARAPHRLRVRVVRRAARLRRRVDPARALPARALARPARRHGRARPLLGDRRGRDRRRAALPDLRQRRHDDGDRADHRHPAAVRQRRRLVDDREPRGDGRAARDPRARPRCALAQAAADGVSRSRSARCAGSSRSSRSRRATRRPLVVGGARELAAVLRRELGKDAKPGGVRAGDEPRGAAVFVYVLGEAPTAEDERALKRARRARVPIVAVAAGAARRTT